MNAGKIFGEIMKQAAGLQGGRSGAYSSSQGGFDPGNLLNQLGRQVGGAQGRGGSGLDLQSMLGQGALGMLLGSRRGRGMGSKSLKYGALASVGAMAWKAFQNYQNQSSTSAAGLRSASLQGEPVEKLSGAAQEVRGQEILQAMIMAARADGHIDEAEQAQLTAAIEKLGADADTQQWIQTQLKAPLDAAALASKASSPQSAREMYVVSVAMCDDQNPMEKAWLDQLAKALQLDAALCEEIERQVMQAA